MAGDYTQKLKDPRWQRKRLEILQRDNWTCQLCRATDMTLHVHHRRYIRGHEPWDYEDGLLVTLCEECHRSETDCARESMGKLIDQLQDLFLHPEIDCLALFFRTMGREAFQLLFDEFNQRREASGEAQE